MIRKIHLLSILILVFICERASSYKLVCYFSNQGQYPLFSRFRFFAVDVPECLCTHIHFGYATVENGRLANTEFNDISNAGISGSYRTITNMTLSNPRLKVLLSVGGPDESSQSFMSIFAFPTSLSDFVRDTVTYLRRYRFDGIDIAWQYPSQSISSTLQYTQLIRELRRAFDTEAADLGVQRLLLTVTLASKKNIIDASYDVPSIEPYIDYANILTYNYHSTCENTTGLNAPLYHRQEEIVMGGTAPQLNQNWTVNYYLSLGLPAEKIILGIPTFGVQFTLDHVANKGVGSPTEPSDTCPPVDVRVPYYQTCEGLNADSSIRWLPAYDNEHLVPYASYGKDWISYDNTSSVALKAGYIVSNSLGGAMVWSMDRDDFPGNCGEGAFPLINSVKTTLGPSADVCAPFPSTTPAPTQDLSPTTTAQTTSTAAAATTTTIQLTTLSTRVATTTTATTSQSTTGSTVTTTTAPTTSSQTPQVSTTTTTTTSQPTTLSTRVATTTTTTATSQPTTRSTVTTTTAPTTSSQTPQVTTEVATTTESEPCASDFRLVCYVTADRSFPPISHDNIPPKLCTHLIYAFATLSEGKINVDTSREIEVYRDLIALRASNPSLKVLLSVGGWGHPQDAFIDMVSTDTSVDAFVQSVISTLRQETFDGLDLAWIYPSLSGVLGVEVRFSYLLQSLSEAFELEATRTSRPRLLLSVATGALKETIDASYILPDIERYADFVNVLAFDYHLSCEERTGMNAPLYSGMLEGEARLNQNWTVQYYLSNGVSRQKLTMGIPAYGRYFVLANQANNGPGQLTESARPVCDRVSDFARYVEICLSRSAFTVAWDNVRQVPFAYTARRVWLTYDNERSVIIKSNYILDNRLGGAMIWSLNDDDFRPFCGDQEYPLVNTIKCALAETVATTTRQTVPTTQSTGPTPTPFTGPTTRFTGPSTQFTGPTTRFTGPTTQFTGSTTRFTGPTTQFTGPTTRFTGPTTQFTGPTTRFTGPTTQFTGTTTRFTGPTTQFTGPTTRFTGPTTQFTGPTTRFTGPTTPATGSTTVCYAPKIPRNPNEPQDFNATCQNNLLLPYNPDCTKYVHCEHVTWAIKDCPDCLYFNKESQVCDFPSNVSDCIRPITGQTTRFTGPTTQFTGPTTRFTGPTTRFTGRTTRFTGPTTQFTGSTRTPFTGPTTRFTGPTTQFTGPTTKFTGTTTQFTGSTTRFTGPTTRFTGLTTRFTGPTTQFTGPTTRFTGPTTRFTGPTTTPTVCYAPKVPRNPNEPQDFNATCQNNLLLPYNPDCTKYVHCEHVTWAIKDCPDCLYFNKESQVCDFPSNVPDCIRPITGPTTRFTGPTTQFTGPTTRFTGPTTQFTGPTTRFTGPTTRFTGPTTRFTGPTTRFTGPTTRFTGPTTQFTGSTLIPFTGPTTRFTGPTTPFTGPTTKFTGPTTTPATGSTTVCYAPKVPRNPNEPQDFNATCQNNLLLPYNPDCTKYVHCEHVTWAIKDCPDCLYFNKESQVCDFPSNVSDCIRPITGPTTRFTGPTTQFTGPTTRFTGPTTQFTGPTTSFTGPTTRFTGPTTRFTGPTTRFTGPTTRFTGPTTQFTGSTLTPFTGPTTRFTGPTTPFTGPTTKFTGPTTTPATGSTTVCYAPKVPRNPNEPQDFNATCQNNLLLPYNPDCTKYVHCEHVTWAIKDCPDCLYFNKESQVCDFPSNVSDCIRPITGPTTRFTGSTTQFTGPTTRFTGPTTQFTGPTTRFTGPTTRFSGPTTQFTGTTTRFTGPTTQFTGPTTRFTGPTTQFTGPTTRFTGPTTQFTGPTTRFTGPTTRFTGPTTTPATGSTTVCYAPKVPRNPNEPQDFNATCQNNLLLPYNPDCTKYVHCEHVTWAIKDCPDCLYFNKESQVCDFPSNVSDCIRPITGPTTRFTGSTTRFTGPTTRFTGPTTQFTGPTTRFTGPTTRFTGPTTQFTGPTTIFTGPTTTPATGSTTVCYAPKVPRNPNEPQDFEALCEHNLLLPYNPDCTKYVHCHQGNVPAIKDCRPCLYFNKDSKVCDYPENVLDCIRPNVTTPTPSLGTTVSSATETTTRKCYAPERPRRPNEAQDLLGMCFHNRLIPYNQDCRQYVHCEMFYWAIKFCPPCLYFNKEADVCDYPENVPECQDPKPPVSATVPVPVPTAINPSTTTACFAPYRQRSLDVAQDFFTLCRLAGDDAHLPVNMDCSSFVHCTFAIYGIFYFKDCPECQYFHTDTSRCESPNLVPQCQNGAIGNPEPITSTQRPSTTGQCDLDGTRRHTRRGFRLIQMFHTLCKTAGQVVPVYNDCSCYVTCTGEGAWSLSVCPLGQFYHSELGTCVSEAQVTECNPP